MRRRSILAGSIASLAAKAARAQEAWPLVGFIGASSRQERFERAFITGLRDRGFAQGRGVEVEFHWTAGSMEPVRAIAAGAIERRAAAIVSGGGNVAMVVRALTSTVPIVFATAAQSIGVAIQEIGFASAEELDRAFTEAAAADAGIMLRDFVAEANAGRIAELAARHRLPVIYEQAELVRAGGLVSCAADFVDMHRRVAGYVARALGLTPPPLLLDYADEVIE